MSWAVILHGGAKDIDPADEEANRRGCLAALAAATAVLDASGNAVDAVVAAVRVLEDDPTFNAGFGSVLTADGEVEMDAAIMDGATLDLGGVAAIRGVRNPIEVARRMLSEPPTLLVGEGARRFAAGQGVPLCDPTELVANRSAAPNRQPGCDTVGCVALDSSGRIAAGTSTGGLSGTLPGRVGDSPLPGCGLYADSAVGGVSLSGDGEMIARVVLGARVMRAMEDEHPEQAAAGALPLLARVGGEAGVIAIARAGQIGWAHNSSHFAVGIATSGSPPRAYVHKAEEKSDAV